MEVYWSIRLVEQYHAVSYKVIMKDIQGIISKKIALQIAAKAVNNTAGLDGWVPTLLVFGAYPRMHSINLPVSTIIQKVAAIKKVMEQVRKF